MFKFTKTKLEGVYVIEPTVFDDARGCFFEAYNIKDFKENGFNYTFLQDNHSISIRGVLRGLHYQIKHPQAKLIRVVQGEIFDVAVDLRKNSKTYGEWVGVNLSNQNKKQLFIPKGFAHGFIVLSDTAEIIYKCDELYCPNDEGGIIYNDPDININWPKINSKIILSEKDKKFPTLKIANPKL